MLTPPYNATLTGSRAPLALNAILRDVPDGLLASEFLTLAYDLHFSVIHLPILYITKQIVLLCFWWARRELNPRHVDFQSTATTY